MARVLLVDEEVEVRRFYRVLLEELDGYEIVDVGTGAAAIEILSHEPIDAVVIDFQARDVDGPHFMEALRALHRDLPIIVDTGNDRFCDYFKNLDANAIVFKSCGFPALERALARATAGASPPLN